MPRPNEACIGFDPIALGLLPPRSARPRRIKAISIEGHESLRVMSRFQLTFLDSVKKKCYAPPLSGNHISVPEPAGRDQVPAMRVSTAVSTEYAS